MLVTHLTTSSHVLLMLQVDSHLWRSWTSCPAAVEDAPLSSVSLALLSGNFGSRLLPSLTRFTFHSVSVYLAQWECGAGLGGGLG